MTKRTRYFIFGAVGFLAVGLTVGLVAYYGGVRGFAEPAGPTELRYVPSDAAVVAFANVKELMGSQFRQQMQGLEPMEHQQGRDEIREALGIDIQTDIDYVVACMLASPEGDTTKRNAYVLARGNFDQPRIETFIRSKGGVEQVYNDKKMFVHPTESGTDTEMGVAFVEAGVVAMGSTTALKKVLDVQAGRAAAVITNQEVMDMIGRVESGNNAWAVGRFDVLSRQAHLPTEMAGQLPQVTWFSAGGHVNGGVNATVSLTARDEEAAKNLLQVATGFMALANMQANSKPELAALLKTVALNSDSSSNTVSLSFSLPSGTIDALKNAAGIPPAAPKH